MMALVVFPTYALARLAVRPGWALFAAAGAGISPALVYAAFLVKEPTAYPIATLALFLIARWIAKPTARWPAARCGSLPGRPPDEGAAAGRCSRFSVFASSP